MKTNKIMIALAMITLGSVTSCKKYLSEAPRVLAEIKTADQLLALEDNSLNVLTAQYPNFVDNGSEYIFSHATDDTDISQALYKSNSALSSFSPAVISTYLFDVPTIANQTSDTFYTAQYRKIFTANVILANVDDVTGSDATKNLVKANAYFIRAYAYWLLVNYYCKPYASANLSGPGMPIKKTTDYAESISRSTLQETYDQILSDVTQAQSYATYDDVQANLRWRVSKTAIDAFLSRYYLFTGDYAKSIQYANSALAKPVAQLVDYNTIAQGTPATYSNPSVTLNYSELNGWNYTSATNRILTWPEFYFPRVRSSSAQFLIPSPSLIALYDQSNDLRFKWFIIPDGGRRFTVVTPSTYRYTQFNDGIWNIEGPSIAEVLLNKAEACARINDLSGATGAINTLRAKRFKTGFSYTLSLSTQGDALTKVLQERRRELPFTFRFLDIRRFGANSDPSDDVTVTRTFYKATNGIVDLNTPQTYIFNPVNMVVPFNNLEIANSQGQIVQNAYQ
ncbi:RagB/SusD family nutrient uptake outer membrane protein [Pedobacter jeongneungensis]|uniref:RagB/SusD family nutrient uptake outer membrane protein n=1 Tax=Pedobacter jeongneungensis TaxID=947309 RepID=UPI00046A562E|nr:RagB/SusD family nutrient uptake outer membrane protein [Pedobacter jeongneungensis]